MYCPNCFSVLQPGVTRCSHCSFDTREYAHSTDALPLYTSLNDQYIIGRVLGQGGFGITYKALDTFKNRVVAIIMPVGEYSKPEIRKIAEDHRLMVAHKPDSQDICFVPDGDYAGYLENEAGLKAVPGDFVDIHGNAIGRHKGIIHYTIGQRKGLGLAMGHPVFVVDIIPETNQVVIGENGDVFSERLICNRLNFMSIEDLTEPMHVKAKIRYNHKGSMCTIRKIDEDLVEAVFDEPVRAVTKGQAVVFYEDDHVLGGGSIC